MYELPRPIDTPPSLEMDFLYDKERFADESADALLCPGPDKKDWDRASARLQYYLFSIQECRENDMDASYFEQQLADHLLKNISEHVRR